MILANYVRSTYYLLISKQLNVHFSRKALPLSTHPPLQQECNQDDIIFDTNEERKRIMCPDVRLEGHSF